MRAALQFLTVLPVRSETREYGAVWFPLVGCFLGLIAAAALYLPLGAIWALVIVTALTGGLHEDGLADVCDAVRAYRTRERMMEILHDSRIGAHGALALVLSVLLRWQAIDHLTGNPWIRLPIALGISRGMMVLLAAITPSARPGLGEQFHGSLTKQIVWVTLGQMVVLAALEWRAALWLIPLQVLLFFTVRQWFLKRLGGVTGDCLGFECQVTEAVSLTLFTLI